MSIRESRKSRAETPPIVSKIRRTQRRPVEAAVLHPTPRPHALCSVSLSAQAKFLSQNEVGTSMRRRLRDFYAVGNLVDEPWPWIGIS